MVTVAYATFIHSGPVQMNFSSMEATDIERKGWDELTCYCDIEFRGSSRQI